MVMAYRYGNLEYLLLPPFPSLTFPWTTNEARIIWSQTFIYGWSHNPEYYKYRCTYDTGPLNQDISRQTFMPQASWPCLELTRTIGSLVMWSVNDIPIMSFQFKENTILNESTVSSAKTIYLYMIGRPLTSTFSTLRDQQHNFEIIVPLIDEIK